MPVFIAVTNRIKFLIQEIYPSVLYQFKDMLLTNCIFENWLRHIWSCSLHFLFVSCEILNKCIQVIIGLKSYEYKYILIKLRKC